MKNYFFSTPPVIVFSHLRWEFVTQRPQHIMKRLAKNTHVLFVEEPVPAPEGQEDDVPAKVFKPEKNITVLQPYTSWDEYPTEVGKLVRRYISKQKWEKPRLWFYSGMFVEMIDEIPHSQVIYDCMDDLSSFLGAPRELVVNERLLLSKADLVFTGGRSLYELKKQYHSNVYCFPSSVDQAHFKKSLSPKTSIPADVRKLTGPRIGFYGVIDERLDLKLLAEVADLNRFASFVIIGPVVKIDPSSLPQRANIHYLGARDYSELPAYLKSFDIAMMPFALNQSTKCISPTKTLEFMAAKKPIISTAIKDVAEVYPQEVTVIRGRSEFTSAIRSYLSESMASRRLRERRQARVVDQTSWDITVRAMEKLIRVTDVKQRYVEDRTQTAAVLNYAS